MEFSLLSAVTPQESEWPEVELGMTADSSTLTAKKNEEIESGNDKQEVKLPQQQYPQRNRQWLVAEMCSYEVLILVQLLMVIRY